MKRKFACNGYHGCQSHCWIEIYPHTDRHVVIATEADDNPGTSVINMAEHIATFVCKSYNIPMDTLIWMECYLGRDDGSVLRNKTSWDLVRFTKTTGPVWDTGM
ncbi:MAG: hypothetical protein OXM61_10945 [Candidatus Poribacteria bacterium]|nr:hypothetical protein [Candidatus Poribacteria bacterium]